MITAVARNALSTDQEPRGAAPVRKGRLHIPRALPKSGIAARPAILGLAFMRFSPAGTAIRGLSVRADEHAGVTGTRFSGSCPTRCMTRPTHHSGTSAVSDATTGLMVAPRPAEPEYGLRQPGRIVTLRGSVGVRDRDVIAPIRARRRLRRSER